MPKKKQIPFLPKNYKEEKIKLTISDSKFQEIEQSYPKPSEKILTKFKQQHG